jgi:ribosomal 50S subunit-recycling heat shock protein
MRLDKFLKVSRIIKRRTVAKEVCDIGRVLVDGKSAKPGTDVKIGDVIEIQYATGSVKAEVLDVSEHVTKEGAKDLYKIITGKEIE